MIISAENFEYFMDPRIPKIINFNGVDRFLHVCFDYHYDQTIDVCNHCGRLDKFSFVEVESNYYKSIEEFHEVFIGGGGESEGLEMW